MKPADDVTNKTKLDNNVIDDDDDDVRFKDDTAALLHVISRVRKAYITPPNGGVCANFEGIFHQMCTHRFLTYLF